jgi:hypothetical protein
VAGSENSPVRFELRLNLNPYVSHFACSDGWQIKRAFSRTTSLAFFIFPDPQENRLAQRVVPGPFRELDLADHEGFDPSAASQTLLS